MRIRHLSLPRQIVIYCVLAVLALTFGLTLRQLFFVSPSPELEVIKHYEHPAASGSDHVRIVEVVVRNNSPEIKTYVKVNTTWHNTLGKYAGYFYGGIHDMPGMSIDTVTIVCPGMDSAWTYNIELMSVFPM